MVFLLLIQRMKNSVTHQVDIPWCNFKIYSLPSKFLSFRKQKMNNIQNMRIKKTQVFLHRIFKKQDILTPVSHGGLELEVVLNILYQTHRRRRKTQRTGDPGVTG